MIQKRSSGSEFRKKNNALRNWLLQRCCIFTRTFWRNDHNLTSCFSFNGCQAAQLEDNSNQMLVNNIYRYIFDQQCHCGANSPNFIWEDFNGNGFRVLHLKYWEFTRHKFWRIEPDPETPNLFIRWFQAFHIFTLP